MKEDRYFLIMCRREPLREPYWWIKRMSSSRVEIESLYDKYIKVGVEPRDMKIAHEI